MMKITQTSLFPIKLLKENGALEVDYLDTFDLKER